MRRRGRRGRERERLTLINIGKKGGREAGKKKEGRRQRQQHVEGRLLRP